MPNREQISGQTGSHAYMASAAPEPWVVVADSEIAKVFYKHHRHFHLVELLRQPDLKIDGLDNAGIGRAHGYGSNRQNYEPSMTESRQGEITFAQQVAGWINERYTQGQFRALALVCSPYMLGELRKHLSAQVMDCVIAESNHQLTNHPQDKLTGELLKIIPGPDAE